MPAQYVTSLFEAFDRYADRPAIVFQGTELSFGMVRDTAYRLARATHDLGVRRGTGIACVSGNRPEALLVRLAAHVLGARITTVVIAPDTHALAHILRDCNPALVVHDGPVPAVKTPTLPLTELLERAGSQSADPMPVHAEDDDIARVMYTSGTTGLPKGVASRFSALGARTAWARKDSGLAELVFVSATSLAQRAGGRCLEHLLSGRRVEIMPEFSPEEFAAACRRAEVAATYLTPTQIYRLLEHPDTREGIRELVSISYGNSRIHPERLAEALGRFPTAAFRQGYGTNETGVIARLTPDDHAAALDGKPSLLASAGRPLPGVDVTIRDHERKPLPASRAGEVWVQSPAMMAGYWNRPDLDAEVFDDGWLRTGDIGRLDADGYLHIVDRLKDMIIVEGRNIYSGPIEAALTRHPAVAEAAVVGRDSPTTGEEIVAFLVPSPGHSPRQETAAEACQMVVDALAPAHRPAIVRWLAAMPLTPTGKTDKNALRRNLGTKAGLT
ncbi:AMP-binding protein [Streptomyces sp. NPDC048665]|uniref:class I adenylate-forming enzyme family protein n=1 Tax=Streptomyces sp. NPDC048665 TaxID=3155490 RepID=UPI003441268D